MPNLDAPGLRDCVASLEAAKGSGNMLAGSFTQFDAAGLSIAELQFPPLSAVESAPIYDAIIAAVQARLDAATTSES